MQTKKLARAHISHSDSEVKRANSTDGADGARGVFVRADSKQLPFAVLQARRSNRAEAKAGKTDERKAACTITSTMAGNSIDFLYIDLFRISLILIICSFT